MGAANSKGEHPNPILARGVLTLAPFFVFTASPACAYTVPHKRMQAGAGAMWTLALVLLAGYGLYSMIARIFLTRVSRQERLPITTVIIIVERANEWIEWFVRKLSVGMAGSSGSIMDILIVDVSDSTETAMIVSRLQLAHPYITYVPSSPERRWADVVALLKSARHTRALLAEADNERDMRALLRAFGQFAK